jgi:hypothetical protein
MRLVTIVFERLPMVWLLLGLLFIAAGLYLGFEYKLTFVYLIVGAFCSLYGLLLFIFLRIERPRKSATSTLSPNFISAGDTMATPQLKQETVNQESEQKDTWQPTEGKPA